MSDSDQREDLDILREGRDDRVSDLLESYRPRLRRMVEARLDPRVRARIDASDVIQESYLDVAQSIPRYLEDPRIPFFLWVRHITGVKLQNLHRHHLGYQKRDARRELKGRYSAGPEASSVTISRFFVAFDPSPSEVVMEREDHEVLTEALDALSADDVELLTLRHVEGLRNQEIAQILEVTPNTIHVRYFRAVKRLQDAVARRRRGGEKGTT